MKKAVKIALGILFLCAVVYILKYSPLSYYIFDSHGREIFVEKFKSYMDRVGIWAPLIFIGFYALSVVFFVPASVATSIGGLVFGNWYGLLLNVISAMIGGTISFFLARYLLRGLMEKLLTIGNFKKLDDKAGEHGFSVIVYLRLMFVPFTYLNFVAGVSKIKFSDFFWGTITGVVPGLMVVTFFVTALKKLLLTYKQPSDLLQFNIIFPVALFVFSFFIPSIIKKFRAKFYVTKEIESEGGGE